MEGIRGRPAQPIELEVQEDLSEADLLDLGMARNQTVPSLQKIRDTHHALARCLAFGMNYTEAAVAAGFSTFRIQTLMKDPAFIDLVEVYKKMVLDKELEAHSEFMRSVVYTRNLAQRMAQEELDRADEANNRDEKGRVIIPFKELTDHVYEVGDRTDFAKRTVSQHLHMDVSNLAGRLAQHRLAIKGGLPAPRLVEASQPPSNEEPTLTAPPHSNTEAGSNDD